jgi:6-phosphogluconolactonase
MNNEIKIFKTSVELADNLAAEILKMIDSAEASHKTLTIALSGGSTPKVLFSLLADKSSGSVAWENVHIFWVDERCVPPEDPDSNFGMTKTVLLDRISIPSKNIHRIMGENDPASEAIRYSKEISDFTVKTGGLPAFDLIILGVGEDGHTASIFPGNKNLLFSDKICEVAVHPVNHMKRVTLTGKVVGNGENTIFMVTGEKKSKVISDIINSVPETDYPVSHLLFRKSPVIWYLDEEAGRAIRKSDNN